MSYTDVQIKQADAALQLLHSKHTYTHGHELYQAMSKYGTNANVMRTKMVSELGLIYREHDNYLITEKGEKAYEMGFRAYMEERERKAKEPVYTKEVEDDKPWWKLTKEGWISLATLIATIVFGISNCCG